MIWSAWDFPDDAVAIVLFSVVVAAVVGSIILGFRFVVLDCNGNGEGINEVVKVEEYFTCPLLFNVFNDGVNNVFIDGVNRLAMDRDKGVNEDEDEDGDEDEEYAFAPRGRTNALALVRIVFVTLGICILVEADSITIEDIFENCGKVRALRKKNKR